MPDRDIYRAINELDPATVQALGERLEFRGSDATFNQMRETYFDQLPLVTAETVLDLGCGTGVEVRALLKRPAFAGHVVAIDHVREDLLRSSTATMRPGRGGTQSLR